MVQEMLVKSNSRRFFVTPYMGPKGWVGVRLDDQVNWDEVAGILKAGYLISAPKKLGGRAPSALDHAASMSDIATKRHSPSLSKMMRSLKGDKHSEAKSRSKRASAIRHTEVR